MKPEILQRYSIELSQDELSKAIAALPKDSFSYTLSSNLGQFALNSITSKSDRRVFHF